MRMNRNNEMLIAYNNPWYRMQKRAAVTADDMYDKGITIDPPRFDDVRFGKRALFGLGGAGIGALGAHLMGGRSWLSYLTGAGVGGAAGLITESALEGYKRRKIIKKLEAEKLAEIQEAKRRRDAYITTRMSGEARTEFDERFAGVNEDYRDLLEQYNEANALQNAYADYANVIAGKPMTDYPSLREAAVYLSLQDNPFSVYTDPTTQQTYTYSQLVDNSRQLRRKRDESLNNWIELNNAATQAQHAYENNEIGAGDYKAALKSVTDAAHALEQMNMQYYNQRKLIEKQRDLARARVDQYFNSPELAYAKYNDLFMKHFSQPIVTKRDQLKAQLDDMARQELSNRYRYGYR